MKKLIAMCAIAVLIIIALVAGCNSGGMPTPPVKKLIDLDKLVANNQTIDQVNSFMTPALKATSMLYQAQTVELTAKGNWKVLSKEGGFKPGETGPYQVIFFQPPKATAESYAVFFHANVVIGKAWFGPQSALIMETILKGDTFQKTQTGTTTPTTTTQ